MGPSEISCRLFECRTPFKLVVFTKSRVVERVQAGLRIARTKGKRLGKAVDTGACLDLDDLIANSVKDQFANRTATELFHDIGTVGFDGLDAYI